MAEHRGPDTGRPRTLLSLARSVPVGTDAARPEGEEERPSHPPPLLLLPAGPGPRSCPPSRPPSTERAHYDFTGRELCY